VKNLILAQVYFLDQIVLIITSLEIASILLND